MFMFGLSEPIKVATSIGTSIANNLATLSHPGPVAFFVWFAGTNEKEPFAAVRVD